MLTKKDYKGIAEILSHYRKVKDRDDQRAFHDLVQAFTDYLDMDNSRFDMAIFQSAVYEVVGRQCPSCESYDITAVDQVETGSGIAWQDIECSSCKATWEDVYRLERYDNLQSGTGKE